MLNTPDMWQALSLDCARLLAGDPSLYWNGVSCLLRFGRALLRAHPCTPIQEPPRSASAFLANHGF